MCIMLIREIMFGWCDTQINYMDTMIIQNYCFYDIISFSTENNDNARGFPPYSIVVF